VFIAIVALDLSSCPTLSPGRPCFVGERFQVAVGLTRLMLTGAVFFCDRNCDRLNAELIQTVYVGRY